MTYRGHVENGVVVFDEPVQLADGVQVEVTVRAPETSGNGVEEIPTLYEQLKPFVGVLDNLPPDYSKNLDHYLYGLPKRT